MAYIILPHRWRRQPTVAIGPAYGNSISSGLIGLWNFGAGFTNLVTREQNTISGTRQMSAGSGGMAFNNDQNSFVNVENLGNWNSLNELTVVLFARLGTSDSYGALWAKQTTAGSNSIQLQRSGTGDQLYVECVEGSSVANFTSGGAFAPSKFVGKDSVIGLVWRDYEIVGGEGKYYGWLDGTLAEEIVSGYKIPVSGTGALKIGASRDASTLAWGGLYYGAAVWKRALLDSESAELGRNFWQLFAPLQRRIYVGPSAGGGAVNVNADVGVLAITGHAPTILGGNTNVAVGAGALTVTGYAPTVTTQESVAADAGALTITGHAPSISLISDTAVSVDAGALTITGAVPTVTTQETVSAGVGALTITGLAPTVEVVSEGQIAVPAASLALTGHAPTVTTQIVVSADVAALALTGLAPTLQVVSDTTVQTGVGALTIAGHAPTASILLNVLPDVGQIVIEGHAPTVTGGTPSVVATTQQAGGVSKARRKPSTRRRKPILINVDGEEFVVSSEAEAVDLIEKAREAAEANARAQSATILEKRKLKAARDGKLNTTPLRLDEPSITVTPAQDGYVDKAWVAQVDARINDAIREAYESAARDAETQLLLAQRIMVDEEDALVALLLTL